MAKKEIEKEIEILRAQVNELIAARNLSDAEIVTDVGQNIESKAEQVSAKPNVSVDKDATVIDEEVISEQFQELIKTVDQELKDASTVTVLLVFSLGVVVGRFLSR